MTPNPVPSREAVEIVASLLNTAFETGHTNLPMQSIAILRDMLRGLLAEVERLRHRAHDQVEASDRILVANHELRAEVERLTADNNNLKGCNAELAEEGLKFFRANTDLRATVAAQVAALQFALSFCEACDGCPHCSTAAGIHAKRIDAALAQSVSQQSVPREPT